MNSGEVPTDGDERSKGGTNRLAGASGLALGFGLALVVLVIAAVALTFFTGKAGPGM